MRVDSRESADARQEFAAIAHAVAIVNPAAGAGLDDTRAAARARLVQETLGRVCADVRVAFTEGRGHAAALARDAVTQGAELVVVWGGDGTVNEAGTALAGSTTALGLVPAGSGNGLAASLRTPRDPVAALTRILRAAPRPIDVGTIDGRRFFNVAGVGFDAHIAALFNRRGPGRRGGWPYVLLGLREGCRYRSREYEIDLDGDTRTMRALVMAFANGSEYGLGLRIAPGARLDDGLLEATLVEDRQVLARFWDSRHFARGAVDRAPGVTIRAIRRATITADGTRPYHADGECGTAEDRLEVSVLPGALLVRA
jgi:YegS/Rv2252/BmrU family lipid kinase